MGNKDSTLCSKLTFIINKRSTQVMSLLARYVDFAFILITHSNHSSGKHEHQSDLFLTASEIDELPVCHINHKDKLISQFSQSNEQLSYLPSNNKQQITFIERERNVVSLVIHKNQICLMKCYENINCLINEVRALHKLKEVDGVPKLIDINLFKKQAYQSFMPGTSLAHSLVQKGCTEEEIYLYENEMSENLDYPKNLFNDYGSNLVSDHFISQFKQLLNDIHQNNVLIRDVKFGNIINYKGRPFIVDFDCASILKNSQTDKLIKFKENALFNRLLPLNLPTELTYES